MALELNPNKDDFIILKADLLLFKKFYQYAHSVLNKVKDTNSNYYIDTLSGLHLAQGNTEAFGLNVAKGLELYANDYELIALKAEASYKHDNLKEAKKYSKKVLEINPNHKKSQQVYEISSQRSSDSIIASIILGIIMLFMYSLLFLMKI